MAQLLYINQFGDREAYPLSKLRTTIGRSSRSDFCLSDAFASRLHIEIRKEGDIWWLHDLGSANGTKYNNQRVNGAIPLDNGGEIKIGETILVFNDESANMLSKPVLYADQTEALDPSKTITFNFNKVPTTELLKGQFSSRTELLGLISKVGVALLASTGLDETLNQVASLVFDAVPAERCVIMLRDENSPEKMQIRIARIRGSEETLSEVRVSRNVMDEVLKNGKSVLTADAMQDPKFASQTMILQGVRSVIAVPLSVDERDIFGLIYADSPTYENTFSEEHLDILTTLGSVASIRVENATLLEERLERERMERELELASEIQHSFQPSSAPQLNGYELQGISFPCYEIGGDYYDFIPTENDKIIVALGDVSGKGTSAALLMSSLHAAIHGQISAKSSIYQTVISVNRYLAENTPSNRFVTLFIGELDPASGSVDYISGGHNPSLVIRSSGSIEELDSGGLPLGLMPFADYEPGKVTLEPNDILVVYSDGVTEANDLTGEEFGIDRLKAVLLANKHRSSAGIRDKVEAALSQFTTTAPANDDITIVIVKRN